MEGIKEKLFLQSPYPDLSVKNERSIDGLRGAKEPFSYLLDKAQEKIDIADQTAYMYAKGESDIPVHKVMISAEEARLSVQLLAEVRNKVLDSYNELIRTAG